MGKKQLAVGEPTFLANEATGNVGIGINTAGYKLQVNSAIPGVAMFFTSSTGNTGNLAFFNGSNHNYGMMGVVSGNGAPTGDVYGLGYAAAANSSFTNVLNWTSTSHVGIGTTTPARSLHIVSPSTEPVALRLERYDAGPFNSGEIAFANLNGEQVYMGLKDNSQLAIKGNSDFTVGQPAFLVNVATGNVGVGTGSPTCNFHVKANDGNADMCLESTNGHAWDLAADQQGNFTLYQPSANANRLLVNSNGNVGIGNSTPSSAKLIIQQDNATDEGLIVQTNHNDNYGKCIEAQVNQSLTKALSVNYNGTTNFLVYGTGDVYARKITVQQGDFPDYVFDEKYKLLPLEEVENYIKQNKHLPGIPSGCDIETKGIMYPILRTDVSQS